MNLNKDNYVWEYQINAKGYNGFHFDLSKNGILEIIRKIKVYNKVSINLCNFLPSQAVELKKLKPVVILKMKIIPQMNCKSQLMRENNVLKISLDKMDLVLFLDSLCASHSGINDFNIKLGNDCIWFW